MPHDQAYLQAEQKIDVALQSGATELDLSQKYAAKDEDKLTELPDSLWQLTQLTELNLSNNQLTTLPASLGQLTQLTSLNLSRNQLTALPDSLGQLTQLTELNLQQNQLIILPPSLGQLTQLTTLNLQQNQLITLPESCNKLMQLRSLNVSGNQLTSLPNWLGQFTKLEAFDCDGNQLTSLPPDLGNLTSLNNLYLGSDDLQGNKFVELPTFIKNFIELEMLSINHLGLKSLPDWLGQLTKLKHLFLNGNSLNDIPSSLAQLDHLKIFFLDDNPLNPALQSAYDACKGTGGYEPLFAYLRSLENAEPLYEAKLVLVGEGNVGKTTLLKALKGKAGEPPQKNEATTHGVEIDIHGLRLPHPQKDGIEIQLNAWDFGGQDVYRVTHQFFFSRRSLYLLVWEPRRGVQQCQVEDWLNMIRLRVGDGARVLIVSTYSTSGGHIARIDKPVFKGQYGDMIVGFYEVDSLVPDPATGEMTGIAELKRAIAEHAAGLEQMGMLFNNDWKAARDELLARDEPRISFSTFSGICAARGLSQLDADTLAHLMHDLGYIVHYSDDENLRDDVVLKPQWLTKAIGFVLEDRATAEREGILPDGHLTQVWRDHAFEGEPRYDPNVYPFFLRLMEKYDVCYRLTDGKASLVAQHVPQVRPELPWLPEQEPPKDQRRIAMVCSMEEDPPGLVPWMIVRTHDYAYPVNRHSLHWQKGMFLRHEPHGEAMLEKRGRDFYIYAQAEWPEHFMNVLHSTLEKLIADNWPGLKDRYRFMVPCPEMVDGQPCKGRFNITGLRNFLAEGDTHVRCQECSCKLSIAELLLGFEESPIEVQLNQLMELKEQITIANDQITQATSQMAELNSRIANYFMAMMRAIADEAKNGPRLFTFRSGDTKLPWKQLVSRPMELQLWCEHEGHPHPVLDKGKGVYQIDQPYEWVVKIAPYANIALDILKTVVPLTAPVINAVKGSKGTESLGIKESLDLADAIIGKLPTEIKSPDRALHPGKLVSEVERSGILALHNLLRELDPSQANIGLHRVATYTGDFRWLCKHHYDAWQPNIPDVIK